jgi:citrate/tricarballylate utilization protein
MQLPDLTDEGARVMTVCNACRYCEQYCPVFPALERRLTFGRTDLAYLANLCHNCGECLYACQYAPPHEFAINVPRTLAELRLTSYEAYCWPRPLAAAFRRHSTATALGTAAGFAAVIALGIAALDPGAWSRPASSGAFYAVVPHAVMVALFGTVGAFVSVALSVGLGRFWRDIAPPTGATWRDGMAQAWRDALTLAHLHPRGVDCVDDEEARSPSRRWLHHATFYGFVLCFLSTSVAAVYHTVLGWTAPYGYASLPVLLGTLGGIGLVVGPGGLLMRGRRRDPALTDPAQSGIDASFVTLLLATSVSGLALLALRSSAAMPTLLVAHLGTVLALFVTLPYGKFVHGFYRAAALVLSARERARERS